MKIKFENGGTRSIRIWFLKNKIYLEKNFGKNTIKSKIKVEGEEELNKKKILKMRHDEKQSLCKIGHINFNFKNVRW